jgi:2-keto-4-pentenoate hydratase
MSEQQRLAELLHRASMQGGLVPRSAGDCLDSVETAYNVQRLAEGMDGLPMGGWKVGATSVEPQRLLGATEPATAPMFQPNCLISPATVAVFPNQSPCVEGEFAFRFSRSLPPRRDDYALEEVLEAVDSVLPAIEVVGCRFEGGFDGLGALRLVADATAHTAFVSGSASSGWRSMDLNSHRATMHRNGAMISEGTGASVLDGPLSVLLWTANHLSRLGDTIAAGEIITTGTCTGITPVSPGDTAVADFGSLGKVELRIADASSEPAC